MDEAPMLLAVEAAKLTSRSGKGGPFGAAITDKDGKVIAVASNTVLASHDPSAHAEINAIREAGRILATHDLSGCTLYATGYPCPMCLSAAIWANIRSVVYGCTPSDAEKIGFRDAFIYRFIRGEKDGEVVLTFTQENRAECLRLFEDYAAGGRKIY